MPGLAESLASLAPRTIRRVVVSSNITPEVEIDPNTGSSSGSPGIGGAVLGLLRPAVQVDTAAGPIELAPWGKPSGNGALVSAALAAGVALLGYLAFRGARDVLRGRRR